MSNNPSEPVTGKVGLRAMVLLSLRGRLEAGNPFWMLDLAQRLTREGLDLEMGTSRPTRGKVTERKMQAACEALQSGRTSRLYLGGDSSEGWSVLAIWANCTFPGDPAFLHAVPGTTELSLQIEDQYGLADPVLVRAFIQLCVAACERTGLAQGLLDHMNRQRFHPTHTALEERLQVAGYPGAFGPRALARFVRGPAWGLWLTAEHVRHLGGLEHVRREAPVHRIDERATGLWMELTPDPTDVTAEHVRRLEAFLAPVTPTPAQLQEYDALPKSGGRAVPERRASAADADLSYAGAPVRVEYLPDREPTLAINVHLVRDPNLEATTALARVVRTWYLEGTEGRYGPGALHDLTGPNVDGRVVRWVLDVGSADYEAAFAELAHRLAAWAATWSCPVSHVRLGVEED